MSDYRWCHGPNCHTHKTQDRIRGSKGNKVLRTRKIKFYESRYNNLYNYFCGTRCYFDFADKHAEQIVAIAPRLEPLEIPVEVEKIYHPEEQYGDERYHSWTRRAWTETTITKK